VRPCPHNPGHRLEGFPRGKVSEFAWPSAKEDVSITHQGTGRPWLSVQSLAAIPLKEPFFSGYTIQKTILPVEQKDPKQWSRGDILRVRLEMKAQADQTWVVVSDPVPAGRPSLEGVWGETPNS